MKTSSTPVLIVGGGPVGLMLAAELGYQGVRCTLVEQDTGVNRFAKIMLVSVRTMEICRRLGIAERVRNWGFPPDYPMDNTFVTSLAGHEIYRAPQEAIGKRKPTPVSPEFQAHCPQRWFDPIILELARSFPGVTIRHQCRLEGYEQDDSGVRARVTDLATGEAETIEAQYLVGCDGYESSVREQMGVRMRGQKVIDHSLSIELRSRALHGVHDKARSGRFIFIGPEGTWCTMMSINGDDDWRMILYRAPDDVRKIDPADVVRRAVGRDFPFEITSAATWTRRAVIAERYRDGRVLLAGDAGHTHLPNGGFGMNTGVADSANLGWKLAATVRGWGGPGLLESYDFERRPVAHRAMEEALKELARLVDNTSYASIEADTPEGAAARARLAGTLQKEFSGVRAWDRLGIHLGHIYSPSPVVVDDGTPLPEDDTWGYQPTSRPGARAPHAWLSEGRSTLDLFGRHHVLLRLGAPAGEAKPLLDAAAQAGMPVDDAAIDDPAVRKLYGCRLALVRPDGHVAWRADAVPAHAKRIIDRVRGAGPLASSRVVL